CRTAPGENSPSRPRSTVEKADPANNAFGWISPPDNPDYQYNRKVNTSPYAPAGSCETETLL
ncbi:hypothetical protein NF717_12430, partial [Lactococcus formosensis]